VLRFGADPFPPLLVEGVPVRDLRQDDLKRQKVSARRARVPEVRLQHGKALSHLGLKARRGVGRIRNGPDKTAVGDGAATAFA
jgi:hypothetical protein